MKTIYYNTAVAKACGRNGIIKAVLLNYIYNYHKLNSSKGRGHPAHISLAEFAYQYKIKDEKGLWQRSFIHKMLKDLEADDLLTVNYEKKQPVYSVSPEIAALLNAADAVVVSFNLNTAIEYGIYLAIVARFLTHIIDNSPNGIAYNLSIKEMSEVNRISQAQIYRAINLLCHNKVLRKMKPEIKGRTKALCLAKY